MPSSPSSAYTETRKNYASLPNNVLQAMIGVSFIADHMKQQDDFNRVYTSPTPPP